MNILGISAYYHDSAACLLQEGQIRAAAQEERFTRIKHDYSFPTNAINYCLAEANIKLKEIDCISFYEKPLLKFDRLLETYLAYAPRGLTSFSKAMPIWLKQKLWIKDFIQKELKTTAQILFPEHHLSHAASAFYPSPFQSAAFFIADGVGEWTTTSFGIGRNNEIKIIADIKFPHSIGLLYSAFTYYCGFKVNSGEYKLMGLAPYGKPRFVELIQREIVDIKENGSFRLNLKYFNFPVGLTMTNKHFDLLFHGLPRQPGKPLEQRHMDIACSIQKVIENIILKTSLHIYKETGERNLCLAGGVALNCVANGRLLRDSPFNNIWIQPAAGDAGGAIGAAYIAWHQYYKKKRRLSRPHDSMSGSYLGPHYKNSYIRRYIANNHIPFRQISLQQIPSVTADLIAKGNIIGWFQGRMEFGPRALGNRSILGDARSPTMQQTINSNIKYRESFRPFAPAILESEAARYFKLDSPSPYMLLTAPLSDHQRTRLADNHLAQTGLHKRTITLSTIPAVTHVDYSARVQTVSQQHNPLFFKLLKELQTRHNCPVVINTSFNIRGEPIVCTPQDAYQCFMRTDMNYLIINNFLISKEDQPQDMINKYSKPTVNKLELD